MTNTVSRHVRPAHPPDPWHGSRARLGMILLSVDRATESELRLMLPPAIGEFHVNRVVMSNECTVDNLRETEHDLARAAAGLLPDSHLDAIGFACTSGAVSIGSDSVQRLIGRSHPQVPVAMPLTAAGRALRMLGTLRIGVLTPYIDEVNEIIDRALRGEGLDIAGFDSFRLQTDAEMTALAPASLRDAAIDLDRNDLEALFICCTALRPAAVIDELEQRIGKPVITSHQAMLWEALARAGQDTPIHGFGRLLGRPGRTLDGREPS